MSPTKIDTATRQLDKAHSFPLIKAPSVKMRVVTFLCMTIAGLLGSCGAARPSKYYQLTVPGDAAGGAQAADAAPAGRANDAFPLTLLVGNPLASHLYREDRIVYGGPGEQMGTYEYQRWAEPPTDMMQVVLLRALRSSGRFRAVYAQRSDVNGDFLLRGRIYDFREVDESPMAARVTVEFEMVDLKTGATVWTHHYRYDEPVNKKDVPAVVAALDRNVQRCVKQVLGSLEEYFAAHPATQIETHR
jgi:ABC-type uncharacterized transport system auxiliary subunit